MDNITGELKGYETLADNYVKPGQKSDEIITKKDSHNEKELKKTLAKLVKDYKNAETNLAKLREIRPMKEFYDAATSLDNFKESIQKVEGIYN